MTAQRFLAAVVFLGAATLTGAGVAMADSTGTPVRHGDRSSLLLTVNGERVTPAGQARNTLLTCNPSGGSHPHADAACAELTHAEGDFGRLPTREELCPMIYAPVTATAVGTFAGKRIDYRHEFPNKCLLERNTGQVFDF